LRATVGHYNPRVLLPTIAVFLSATQSTPNPDYASRIAQTETISTASEARVIAYDTNREVIGSIEAWRDDDDGVIVIYADYADGFAQYTLDIEGGSVQTDSDLPPDVLRERFAAMTSTLEGLDAGTVPQEGILACGASILATAVATAAASGIGATLGGLAIVCNCPKLVNPKLRCSEHW
jgi:hypothetical protein